MSWLDLDTVKHALAHLEAMAEQAKAPAGDGGANDSAKNDATKPDATGLASKVSLDRFVAAAKKLESEHQWKKLTRDQRAIHMVGAANDELVAAGVRPIHHRFSDELNASNPGRFVHELWRMELSKALFSQAKLKPGQGADLADTIYHEARHAEQNYRIVQLLAGQKKSVDEIKELTHIDQETIKTAHQQPIDPAGGAHAQALFDDKYGAGKEHHHDAEVVAKEKLKAYHDLLVRLESKDASPEEKEAAQKQLEAMKPEAMAAWNAYSSLATEADAFAVGNRVKAKMQ